jgi:hypothetical protein
MSKRQFVDLDAIRADFGVSEQCSVCRFKWICGNKEVFTHMDVCSVLDEAQIVPAIPIDWMLEEARKSESFEGVIIRGVVSEWLKIQGAIE